MSKAPLRLLHLSNTPLSNAPDNLVRSLNHYGHKATLLLNRKANTNKIHVGGKLWRDSPYEELHELFEQTDVIHFHNYCWELEIFKAHPELLTIARKKPCLIQYHSPRDSIENFEPSIADKSLKHAVIAQYHVRQYPECEFIVPNVIPTFEKAYQPMPNKWADPLPIVSYSPSNTHLKGWDNKGFHVVDPVLRKLDQSGRVVRDLIVNTPYEECMNRKRWAHIGIDEVMTGSYHLSTLEYLAMGCLTIVRIDDLTRDALRKVIGDGGAFSIPTCGAAPENLEDTLIWAIQQGMPFIQEYGRMSRAWMEAWWNPESHVRLFENVYRSL